MSSDICEGCYGINQKTRSCFVKLDLEDYENCPCGRCLVKSMCSEVCQERVSFYANRYRAQENVIFI